MWLAPLAFPLAVQANAGTPLMWAEALHLLFGNLFIGIGEGLLLGWLWGIRYRRTLTTMILANYTSAWLGGVFIIGDIVRGLPLDLTNGWKWFWIMVLVAYAITLAVEWPFILWGLRERKDRLKASLRASVLVQSASYVLLFGWYWMASATSLYTRAELVSPSALSLPSEVQVYYISPKDGHVYRRFLTGNQEEKVFRLSSWDPDDRLLVRPSAGETNRWDLVARLCLDAAHDFRLVVIRTNLAAEVAPDTYITEYTPPRYEGTEMTCGMAPTLGGFTNSPWHFETRLYPAGGLRVWYQGTPETEQFAYETPFGMWCWRNAVHLPSDQVLFQLGDDQICAFDPVRRQVALLWRGRGPVPVIEKPPITRESGNKSSAQTP